MENRRKTRVVSVKDLKIGGDAPVSIQTMGKMPLTLPNLDAIVREIQLLEKMGCHLIRFAVPDESVLEPLSALCRLVEMPVVADIHFDYKLALGALGAGVDKIRINPGNIGAHWKVEEVLNACAGRGVPIRIGVNGGSLSSKYKKLSRIEGMLASAEEEIEILERCRFDQAVFSLKSSDAVETVEANQRFSKQWDYPLHLGVTEAGPMLPALVKSSIALSRLLDSGIGDTIRVSISDDSVSEVKAAREILKVCGRNRGGVTIVSCPKCGRAVFDNENLLIRELEDYLYQIDKEITVAVMGCPVNGPGEAKEADLGVTGSGDNIVIFKRGKLLTKVSRENVVQVLKEEIEKL